MSWRPDIPVELSDGTLRCKLHHLEICGICCCDYTFMRDIGGEEEESEEEPKAEAETFKEEAESIFPIYRMPGKSFRERDIPLYTKAGLFIPPCASDTPLSLFEERQRFVRRSDRDEMLIFTDGACPRNGEHDAPAGCAFIYGCREQSDAHAVVDFPLEDEGPLGDKRRKTSNRAELRAVIAALHFRAWHGEGWARVVIATDSEYVAKGATMWALTWERNGWRNSRRAPVENQDLWQLLLDRVRHIGSCDTEILFWQIPRALNGEADQAAKAAALRTPSVAFTEAFGILV